MDRGVFLTRWGWRGDERVCICIVSCYCKEYAEGVELQSPGSRSAPWVRMPQSLVQVYVHIVFSTKGRRPFLQNRELRERMHAYLAKVCHNQGSPSLRVGGVEDHVHALCRLAKASSISNLLQELKRESSKWIKKQDPALSDFYWQGGYGAFSTSPAEVNDVTAYIANQEEHHRHESFQDEFRRLCKQYGVEIDERYVWD